MKQNNKLLVTTTLAALTVVGTATTINAQSIAYLNPGWDYAYLGDAAAAGPNALDGTWTLPVNDSQWDGSAIGAGAPGGASALTDSGVNYLRMQDPGDPRQPPASLADPSNRKIGFAHDISSLVGTDPLDTGITLSFRARVPTTGTLDPLNPANGSGPVAYPAAGDGYLTHDDGKGGFSIHQVSTGNVNVGNILSFTLTTSYDANGASGLMMPNLNGTVATPTVDYGEAGTPNFLAITDTTAWHEFWITIQAGGTGTQVVSIYMDGSTTPAVFDVTAGTGNPASPGNITMGMDLGATPQTGALDVDFFAVKNGVNAPTPVPEPGVMALAGLGLAILVGIQRRKCS